MKTVLRKTAACILPNESFVKLYHFWKFGHIPNVDDPRTFRERLLHGMLRTDQSKYVPFVDKATARQHVARLAGEQYLPTLYHQSSIATIPIDRLPERFVVRANHGSEMTLIVNDKRKLELPLAEVLLNSWLRNKKYGADFGERYYSLITPCLLFEQNLCDEAGSPPVDYKFFCFGGNALYIQVDIDRFTNHRRSFFDMNWSLQNIQFGYPIAGDQPKPLLFDELVQVARLLSTEFEFVRVDLYCVEGRVYFGEFTFFPEGCLGRFVPESFDRELGDLWPQTRR